MYFSQAQDLRKQQVTGLFAPSIGPPSVCTCSYWKSWWFTRAAIYRSLQTLRAQNRKEVSIRVSLGDFFADFLAILGSQVMVVWVYKLESQAKCSKSFDLTAIAMYDSNRQSQITRDLRHCEPPQTCSIH